MSSKPLLSAAQWRAIAPLLPEKLRRDQTAIEAILFREFSGRSLTEVSETFGRTGLLRLQLTWSALRQETLRPPHRRPRTACLAALL